MKDYYYILGVKPEASQNEIKTAYRKLSVKFHPDKNDGDDFFTERFKEIQEAWEILSNETRRNNYDYERFGGTNRNEAYMPKIIFFRADKTTFDLDEEVTFTWETVNADKVTLNPIGSVTATGSNKYRIKIIKSAVLNFDLVAENSLQNKASTSSLSLTKRSTQIPEPPKAPQIDWDAILDRIIKGLEGIAFFIEFIALLSVYYPVLKSCLRDSVYEPLTIKFFLNQLGGEWKTFKDWVYEPETYVAISTLIGWIFKIIFMIPSIIPLYIILYIIIKLWFGLITLVVEWISERVNIIAGYVVLTAIVIWMVTWFV